MAASLDCPGIECWLALFDNEAAPDQWEQYERHLESCLACQQRLDQTAEVEDALRAQARRIGDPTLAPADPTLVQVVARLCERIAAVEPVDLYFLRPSDQPGVLGVLGDFEVREVIGQGSMGVVLKAYEPALHRLVAVKVLAPALAGSAVARRRFTRESQAAAAVCHEHIVPVYGVREADGLPYLVMQYVAGESLQERLDRCGPLEVEEVVRIGRQTALGLAAAHARGLIHRDIKPANLLLEAPSPLPPSPPPRSGEGGAESALPPPLRFGEGAGGRGEGDRVKITDFGLARLVDDVGLTQNGVVAGTPEYMAPEQARGEPIDHRADLFSLGSVLYAMCTGGSPFRGATTAAVIHKVCEQAPTPLRSLHPAAPVWLEGFITRLLAKNPADRFQTASEAAALLEGFLAHLRQPATIAEPELPNSPGRRRPPFTGLFSWPAVLLVGCVAAVLGLGMFYWFAGVDGPEPGKEEAREWHQPLRGISENTEGVVLMGPDAQQCVKFEPEGVRITLPAGFPNERPATGLRIAMPAHGDFDMTIRYEILAEPEQANAGRRPTKLAFQAILDRRDWTVAAIARRTSSEKGTQFTTWTIRENHDNSGSRQMKARQHDAQARVGRLRIARTGAEASFYAAEGPDADFTLLGPPRHLGEEDLKSIELIGATGFAKAALDVRFTDLRVCTSTRLASPSSEEPVRRTSRHGLALLTVVLAGLTLVAGLLLRRSRRDRVGRRAADVDAKAGPPAGATVPIAFRCPACDRGLKARAGLAGKKVKCPQCGTSVGVPLAAPARPGPVGVPGAKGRLLVWLGLASASLGLVLLGVWLVWLVWPVRALPPEDFSQRAEPAAPQASVDQQPLPAQPPGKGQGAGPGPGDDALPYQEAFKGRPEKPLDFAFLGPGAGKSVRFEAEGLRIQLAAGKNHPPTGLATTFGVRGDFTITVRYEILEEPAPADAGTPNAGTRISLTVNLDGPQSKEAAIRRKVTPTQPVHILAWRAMQQNAEAKPESKGHIFSVKEKTGRLRLARTAARVSYYLSEGVEKEFTLLTTQPFAADDVKNVQLFGQTSSPKAALDVRFTDLHIAAASLVRKPANGDSRRR